MAKVLVCDICKHEGKLTETTRYYSVKGKPHLRLDYCPACKSKVPDDMTEYKKFVARIQGLSEDAYTKPSGLTEQEYLSDWFEEGLKEFGIKVEDYHRMSMAEKNKVKKQLAELGHTNEED